MINLSGKSCLWSWTNMINTDDEKLAVFGFGLSLIIPFIVLGHFFKGQINFFVFLGLFISLMFIISKSVSIRPLYFLTWAGIYTGIIIQAIGQGLSGLAIGFLGLSVSLLVMTLINPERLTPIYTRWMKAVRSIRSAELLSIIFYYTSFAIAGIVLKLIRKDLLHRALEPEKRSYWIKKERKEFNREQYKKQF